MNYQPLLDQETPMRESRRNSPMLKTIAGVAIAACVATIGMNYNPISQNTMSLWLNQPKDEFNWNVTQVLEWTSVNLFVNLAVSPLGDLYGFQTFDDKRNVYNFIYKFDFSTGQWSLFDKDFQGKDIRFDKLGNFYLLDVNGTVYDKNSKSKAVFKNVVDFEPRVDGNMWIISQKAAFTAPFSASAWKEGQWDTESSLKYKRFNEDIYSRVALVNDIPVFVNATGYTSGYGTQCVRDISAGVDGSLWALDCQQDTKQNSEVLKWDPYVMRWYRIPGTKGIKIGAFNEVSAAVLDAQGRIFVSSDTGR